MFEWWHLFLHDAVTFGFTLFIVLMLSIIGTAVYVNRNNLLG